MEIAQQFNANHRSQVDKACPRCKQNPCICPQIFANVFFSILMSQIEPGIVKMDKTADNIISYDPQNGPVMEIVVRVKEEQP